MESPKGRLRCCFILERFDSDAPIDATPSLNKSLSYGYYELYSRRRFKKQRGNNMKDLIFVK